MVGYNGDQFDFPYLFDTLLDSTLDSLIHPLCPTIDEIADARCAPLRVLDTPLHIKQNKLYDCAKR